MPLTSFPAPRSRKVPDLYKGCPDDMSETDFGYLKLALGIKGAVGNPTQNILRAQSQSWRDVRCHFMCNRGLMYRESSAPMRVFRVTPEGQEIVMKAVARVRAMERAAS